ncbi:hypothetical protein AB8B21_05595 [Tardiphaga sp. 866_E4_N2_1]|uniref:hypothetical protein n=1 Tax=unclassified Tardiphaga TaxID=2631404 RepID=UPI003F25F440
MEAQQLSFDDYSARELRDIGMVEAEFAETLSGSNYPAALAAAIRHVALRQCEVFIDDVLPLIKAKPSHPNSAGAVWIRAIKDGVIVETKESRRSRDPVKHRHKYTVYASGLFYGRRA